VLGESWRRKHRFAIRDLLADKRCSQAVLDFLSTTEVGRLVPTEEGAESEASGWEIRQRQEREEERRPEALGLGREHRCSYPHRYPPSWHPQTRTWGGGGVTLSFCVFSLFLLFFGAYHIILGRAWAEGEGELATCRHARTVDGETWTKCTYGAIA